MVIEFNQLLPTMPELGMGLPNDYNLTPYRFMNSTNSQSKKGPQRANVGFHEAP